MRYSAEEQRALDKAMCKPGYTWSKALKRCVSMSEMAIFERHMDHMKKLQATQETALDAIKSESQARKNERQ